MSAKQTFKLPITQSVLLKKKEKVSSFRNEGENIQQIEQSIENTLKESPSIVSILRSNPSQSQLPGVSIGRERRGSDSVRNFLRNIEYRWKGKDSPGPGQYEQHVDNPWNNASSEMIRQGISMPKSKRFPSETTRKQQEYSVELDVCKLMTTIEESPKRGSVLSNSPTCGKGAKIGTAPRDIDPIRFGTHLKELVLRGIH
ncbi:hypothetical protein FGO68_gene16506 [Halteria grandinella]|uniref:Uncharacterized protein n=1 Tax=Halteria grandinella TaxID=5974 RepID=A0A8J8NUP5_HALGN|nr:hypothetical protein FGO68_gene16506 [Halteria grandinella]